MFEYNTWYLASKILGNSMMMRKVPYDAIFSNILRKRHLRYHQYSSIASFKFKYPRHINFS